eukprot:m.12401 g.12401  ORF g.12401 m.12401 type:complete len:53 (-) comp9773_c0_seq1:57-215(-)
MSLLLHVAIGRTGDTVCAQKQTTALQTQSKQVSEGRFRQAQPKRTPSSRLTG